MSQTTLPAPPVPPDADLYAVQGMSVDVLRLRDSDLSVVSDAEVFRCAVLSWCVAWHQKPAGSLPDNDRRLAYLLGYGQDVLSFKRFRRKHGLHGWAKHSDGRLYHPELAATVNKELARRAKRKERTRKATEARQARAAQQRDDVPQAANLESHSAVVISIVSIISERRKPKGRDEQ